jgi:hypothetical protein
MLSLPTEVLIYVEALLQNEKAGRNSALSPMRRMQEAHNLATQITESINQKEKVRFSYSSDLYAYEDRGGLFLKDQFYTSNKVLYSNNYVGSVLEYPKKGHAVMLKKHYPDQKSVGAFTIIPTHLRQDICYYFGKGSDNDLIVNALKACYLHRGLFVYTDYTDESVLIREDALRLIGNVRSAYPDVDLRLAPVCILQKSSTHIMRLKLAGV